MSPRDIQPNWTHLIHRRVAKGNELLCKCPETRTILAHSLFEAAQWYGIDLHAVVFLEGEYYLVLNDRHAFLPLFMQRFNQTAAMSLKALHKLGGVFWEPGRSYEDTILDNREDILRALAFVHAAQKRNMRRHDNRAPTNGWDFWDTVGTIERPRSLWGGNELHEEARMVMPEALADEEPHALEQQIQELARQHKWPSRMTRKERRRASRGRQRTDVPRFRLTDAAARRGLLLKHQFQHAYRKAWKRLQCGIADLFPQGTWWLAFHSIVQTTAA